MPTSLADAHDVLLVDLDGTVRLAGDPIPHAVESLNAAAERGVRAVIVTNNPSKSPQQVAESLAVMGLRIGPDEVVTSAQVAASMLSDSHPAGARVLVLGTAALCDAVAAAGMEPVRSARDTPVAVVQGHSPETCWGDLAEACIAIRSGVDWVATNTDPTLPTDRGLLPGNGSMVQALIAATERSPRVAGKPRPELLDAAVARVGARRPLVVGDRLDTDIAAAVAAGMPSLFVLTGVSTPADLLAAPPEARPSFVAADLRGLTDSAAVCELRTGDRTAPAGSDGLAGVGSEQLMAWTATLAGHRIELRASHEDEDSGGSSAVAALAVLAGSAWCTGVTAVGAGDRSAAAALQDLGLA